MRDLVLLLGMQGAGKGTVGRLLAEDAGVTHLSAGFLLREHARAGGQHSAEILAHIDKGEAVNPSISYGLLSERVRELESDQLLLLDAYPREASQLNLLEETVGTRPALVVNLVVPRPVAIERLRDRETCEDCDATFGPDLSPRTAGTCDQCTGQLARRADDTKAAIGERLDGWARHGPLLLARLAEIAPQVNVDATRNIERVVADVKKSLPNSPN